MEFTSMFNAQQIIKDIYEKGISYYNTLNNYSVVLPDNPYISSHCDCNECANLLEKELLEDNIKHIILEVFNENTVFDSSKYKMVNDITKCFNKTAGTYSEDIMHVYLYNKITKHKSNNNANKAFPKIIKKMYNHLQIFLII